MWTIVEDRTASKQISKAPKEIQKAFEFWKNVAQIQGPMGIRAFPGFKDHTLKGDWEGARTSYLNKLWRVIYFVKGSEFTIIVMEVNAHDYRKKS